jgi:hypothetical protein
LIIQTHSYNVKRSPTSGTNYVTVANVTSTNAVDIGLTNGTIYYYVVSALNAGGGAESTNAAQVSVRPTSLVSPQLQAILNAGQLQFTWPADHVGWSLQAQTNANNIGLSTNWVTMANSSATNQMVIPIGTTNGSVFFRLLHP